MRALCRPFGVTTLTLPAGPTAGATLEDPPAVRSVQDDLRSYT